MASGVIVRASRHTHAYGFSLVKGGPGGLAARARSWFTAFALGVAETTQDGVGADIMLFKRLATSARTKRQ
jgi:hypothetical protein